MMFKDELKKLRQKYGLTQEELAQKMGLSKSTISMYENGNRVPSLEQLEAFADFFHADLNILTGKEAVLPENILPLPTMRTLPLLGTIACGAPILAQQNIEEQIDVPEHIRADFALRCKGDSMVGARIHNGDIVYIRKQPDVDNGEIAAVLIEEEATLKRVYKYPNKVVLSAENPAYEPLVYTGIELEQIRILGKAVGFTSCF